MNLRPPGPQPERSRRTHCDSLLSSGLSCSGLLPVALNLHPRLHPANSHVATTPGLSPRPRAPRCASLLERRASGALAIACWTRASPPERARFRRAQRRLLLAKAAPELRPPSDCSGCSFSSMPAATRPTVRLLADCSIRRETVVSTCAPAHRSFRASGDTQLDASLHRGATIQGEQVSCCRSKHAAWAATAWR